MMTFIWICLVLVILSMVSSPISRTSGPSTPDRLIALDAIGVMLISAIALPIDFIRYWLFHRSHITDCNNVVHRDCSHSPNSLRKERSSNVTVIANILIVSTIVVGIIFTIVTVIGILRYPMSIREHMLLLKAPRWVYLVFC